MSKLIKNWKELAQVPANRKYQIIVDEDMCCGWIIPITDVHIGDGDDFLCNCEKGMTVHEYYEHHTYLSTHTFYGSNYKRSTEMLQKHGFDVEIDNWDKVKTNE